MSENIRVAVRDRYGRKANETDGCCGRSACDCGSAQSSASFGYTFDELSALPDGADLALGCGNPTALAEISEGETVVDLGSGGGIDCFLAARKAGPSGRVIGVDMTPEIDLITGCVAAALEEAEYLERIRSAGFDSVDMQKSASYGSIALFEPLLRDAGLEPALAPELAGAVRSVTVRAQKR